MPCPAPSSTLPLGVSGLTEKQTDALIAAVASAGTDDPTLAIFGFTIVRSDGITSAVRDSNLRILKYPQKEQPPEAL